MENSQLELTEEQVQELLSSGLVEEQEECDKITFDINVIASMEEISQPVESEFNKGVFDASQYIGQFSALINAGLDSDAAIVFMSWIREDKLNKDNINGQIELAKYEGIKLKRESL